MSIRTLGVTTIIFGSLASFACGDGGGSEDGADGNGGAFVGPVGSGGAFGGSGAPSSGGVAQFPTGGAPPFGTGGASPGTGGLPPGTGGVFAGTGGVPPATGGAPPATGGAPPGTGGVEGTGGAVEPPPTCVGGTKGSQGIIIGDSFFALSGRIAAHLYELSRMAGVLGPFETYRDYAVIGTSMGNGQIPGQFDRAVQLDPDIRFVIGDGGGNDVLILNPQCKSVPVTANSPSCVQTVTTSLNAFKNMMNKMGTAGVEDFVYFFYPDVPATTGDINGYAIPFFREACEAQTAPRCHFIDTRQAFAGHPDYINFDGIHPSRAGSDVVAQMIWDVMVANCIGQ